MIIIDIWQSWLVWYFCDIILPAMSITSHDLRYFCAKSDTCGTNDTSKLSDTSDTSGTSTSANSSDASKTSASVTWLSSHLLRNIVQEILSELPRIPGGSNNGGGRCATAAAASTIGDHFRKSLFFHLPKEHHQNYFRKHSRPCLWPVRKAAFDTQQVLVLSLKRHAFLFIGNFLGIKWNTFRIFDEGTHKKTAFLRPGWP